MKPRFWLLGLVAALTSACGARAATGGTPASPTGPPEYLALPDTLVCVVDRATDRGLRVLPGKVGSAGVVVSVDRRVVPLSELHPVTLIAGYAGREPWLTRGDPIPWEGRRFLRTGGERRIGLELLRRVGEFQGILLFAGADDDAPPDALYLPTAPACIFQAYVREDLLRR